MYNPFATPWTIEHQAPLSLGCPRQEYWIGLPFPFPGTLPNPGIKPTSPVLAGDCLPLSHQGSLCVCVCVCVCKYPLSECKLLQKVNRFVGK